MNLIDGDKLITDYDMVNNIKRAVRIEDGLKIKIRDFAYEELLDNKEINDKFNLNAKRLNRWWYSVYFEEK